MSCRDILSERIEQWQDLPHQHDRESPLHAQIGLRPILDPIDHIPSGTCHDAVAGSMGDMRHPVTPARWAREPGLVTRRDMRSEEHTSELQSLMRISYAVFCLKQKQDEERTTNTKA